MDKKVAFDNTIGIDLKGYIEFPLDSVTKRNARIMHYSESLNSLVLFNDINHTLYFFEVDSQKNYKKIKLNKEGPNGISSVDDIYVHTKDSIFIYNGKSHRLNLFNYDGNVQARFPLFDLTSDDPTHTSSPSFLNSFINKEFYLLIRATTGTSKMKDKALMVYSLNTSNKSYHIDLPKSYYSSYWAEKSYNRSGILNREAGKFIVSYPFDKSLFVLDLQTNKVEVFDGSSQLMHKTKPIEDKRTTNMQDRIIYQMTNSWYSELFYDKYRNLYLRSASIGRDIEYGEPTNLRYLSNNKDDIYTVTVVLDENFNKIAEFPNLYFNRCIFSTEKGLFFLDNSHDPDNEDILTFAHYELKEGN
tara:strand:+ start:1847 stop:2923 length:1077 start_codon:yes stop_codon:yes gene_type:complete